MSLFRIGQEIRLPVYRQMKYTVAGRTATGYLIMIPVVEPVFAGEDALDLSMSHPNKIFYDEAHLEGLITRNAARKEELRALVAEISNEEPLPTRKPKRKRTKTRVWKESEKNADTE